MNLPFREHCLNNPSRSNAALSLFSRDPKGRAPQRYLTIVSLCLLPFLFLLVRPVLAQQGGKGVDLESEMPADAHHLKIGDPAPDFSLKGVDGKTYTLADFKDSPFLMVAFLSNHCPYSHAVDSRLVPMA